MEKPPGKIIQRLARVCLHCPVCRQARKRQRGLLFWLVNNVEDRLCPFCKAYKQVYGRNAHEPTDGR